MRGTKKLKLMKHPYCKLTHCKLTIKMRRVSPAQLVHLAGGPKQSVAFQTSFCSKAIPTTRKSRSVSGTTPTPILFSALMKQAEGPC